MVYLQNTLVYLPTFTRYMSARKPFLKWDSQTCKILIAWKCAPADTAVWWNSLSVGDTIFISNQAGISVCNLVFQLPHPPPKKAPPEHITIIANFFFNFAGEEKKKELFQCILHLTPRLKWKSLIFLHFQKNKNGLISTGSCLSWIIRSLKKAYITHIGLMIILKTQGNILLSS